MAHKKSTAVKQTQAAAAVVKKFKLSWDYAKSNHHQRWERNWKLYNNVRWKESYVGTTSTFVPLTFSTVETITAALCAGRPSTDFEPQDMYKYIESYVTNGVKPDLKALNAQYDYFWDCDNWDIESMKTTRTTLIYGISGEWIYWDGDKPRIINMNPRDLIIDPSLIDPKQLWTDPNNYFTGRRYMTTKAALEAQTVVDPETGELKPRFKNLGMVTPGSINEEATDKEKKEAFLGAVSDTKDLIEVLEIWTGETIQSVANRTTVIEDRKNDLGIHCLGLTRFIVDESSIYGKAVVDPIAAPQELLNDVTNQSVDAVTSVLSPQYELDPMYKDYIERITEAPGTVYPFKPGSLQMIQKPSIPSGAFNERQNMKNEIRETTGADQIVQGVTADSQTTATEIKAQLNQAGQRFELYVRMLEREGFYSRAKIVLAMMLYYMKDKSLVPSMGMDGPKFRAFDPAQYDTSFEPKVRLEATIQNAQARDFREASENYKVLISDPTNDLWQVKKVMYPKMFKLNEEELDLIIGAQKPAQPAAPELGMSEPGAAQAPAPMTGEVMA